MFEEAKLFLWGFKLREPGPQSAHSSNHEGTSFWAYQSQSTDNYSNSPSLWDRMLVMWLKKIFVNNKGFRIETSYTRLSSNLCQNWNQGSSQMSISIRVVERHCPSCIPTAASSPNAVDILLNVVRKVKVHHMLHIWNIQTACSHRRRHQDRTLAGAEVWESLLSLPLLTVSARKYTMLKIRIQNTDTHMLIHGQVTYPWMLVVGTFSWHKKVAIKSACRLVSTKTMVRSVPATRHHKN